MRVIKLKKGSKNKYNAKRAGVDFIVFHSIAESKRYIELKQLQKAGEVLWFHRQVIFDLPGGVIYKADFQIIWKDWTMTYEDVKGHVTKDFIKTKKIVEGLYERVEIVVNKMGRGRKK